MYSFGGRIEIERSDAMKRLTITVDVKFNKAEPVKCTDGISRTAVPARPEVWTIHINEEKHIVYGLKSATALIEGALLLNYTLK